MKTTYTLFRIFGIPVTVDMSLLILMFILISNFGDPIKGITAGFVLLLSILLHELGHSVVGIAFGGKVRDIRLMMLGGCATMTVMPKKAWQESLMAFAGPLVSLLISGVSYVVLGFVPGLPGLVVGMLSYAMWINIILFCFNMLPAFPMDGGRILRATLQQFFTTRLKATWIASRLGRFVAILMAVSVLYSFMSDGFQNYMIISLLIAWMIFQSAEREYQMVLAEERGTRQNPFGGFPFFNQGRNSNKPPLDDGQAVVSPPPYQSRGTTRVDVHKED